MNGERVLYLTRAEMRRLRDVLATAHAVANGSSPKSVLSLEALLKTATIAPGEYLPSNVVTIGSKVRISEAGKERVVTVVFPGDGAESSHALSILDPVGSAILGREEGESVACEGPGTKGSLVITKVLHQPIDCQLS